MKKVILLYLAIAYSSAVFAQGINFLTNDIQKAFAQARAQQKILFVEVYSSGCHHCAALEPILKQKAIGDFYNQNFISYKLEVSTADVQNFLNPKRLYIPSLPMLLFFDANQNLLHCAAGPPDPNKILEAAKVALNPAARASNYRTRYANGERSNDFLFDLALYCRVVCDTTLNIKVMEEYARRTPASTYGNTNNWLVLQKLMMDIDNPLSQYLVNNYSNFKSKYDAKEVKLVAENLLMSSLYSSRGAKYDATQIQKIRQGLLKIGVPADAANARTVLPEIKYYFRQKQTPKATARAEEYFNNTKPQLADYLYIIKLFNSSATDNSYKTTATKWVNKAKSLNPNTNEAKELATETAKLNARK